MLNYEQEQRSVSWYRDRLGLITGSRVGQLMKSGRAKNEVFSSTAKTYIMQVVAERALNPEIVGDDEMLLYYVDQTSSVSKAMRFGTEQEEHARDMYASFRGLDVEEVGLCKHRHIKCFASSPDGIVNDNGVLGCVEIKCPTPSTYAQYKAEIRDNDSLRRVNPDYFYQCMAHMSCTGAQFCDFVVFCPFMAAPLHVVRILRDQDAIASMESRVKFADTIIADKLNELNNVA